MKHVGNAYGNPYETFPAHFCILPMRKVSYGKVRHVDNNERVRFRVKTEFLYSWSWCPMLKPISVKEDMAEVRGSKL